MATKKFVHSSTKNGKTVYREYTYFSNDSDAERWDEGDFGIRNIVPDVREYSQEEWTAKTNAELKGGFGILAIILIILGGPTIVSVIGSLLGAISHVVYYAIAGGVGSLLLLGFICSKTIRKTVIVFVLVILFIIAMLFGMQLLFNGGRL